MLSLQEIAARLHARRSGRGFIARCPAHEDRHPSLSLSERDGRVLVHCHAGCAQADVIAALRDRGLWPEQQAGRTSGAAVTDSDWQGDLERASYWAITTELFSEWALEELPFWHRDRYPLTQLLTAIRLGDASMVAEYRKDRQRDPKMTAGLVRAGRLHDARVQRKLAHRLKRYWNGLQA
jgi:hypothetical protein